MISCLSQSKREIREEQWEMKMHFISYTKSRKKRGWIFGTYIRPHESAKWKTRHPKLLQISRPQEIGKLIIHNDQRAMCCPSIFELPQTWSLKHMIRSLEIRTFSDLQSSSLSLFPWTINVSNCQMILRLYEHVTIVTLQEATTKTLSTMHQHFLCDVDVLHNIMGQVDEKTSHKAS